MRNLNLALLGSIVIYLGSLILITPLINGLGYASTEVSATHRLLVTLIFLVIFCTMLIIEGIRGE
ncbi:hypothetical protein [Isachenkonia alkalipeptolytica]|uniref:Uncharacterized protein n=1 Tax=Isachenkonia alkalipeptolytica TaxID=2565777 RepID=A0AA44BDX9_9CLOT|nr:hypothetical protein [Isachenkonia alkalipeptolytica]NBG88422.1 hypothetical protein [Isachenkonia alkalipeptolytica]